MIYDCYYTAVSTTKIKLITYCCVPVITDETIPEDLISPLT